MLLIYTHRITPRVSYIIDHFFKNLIRVNFKITSETEEYTRYKGPKLTYSKQPIGDELFITSHNLLFEQSIRTIDINLESWEGIPCFFATGRSCIPFDIFAASFFLLTRYEECYPSLRDIHGRYNYKESVAFKHGFIDLPLVDIWAKKFSEILQKKYPNISLQHTVFKQKNLIDVSEFYAFRRKDTLRTIGGTLLDIYQLKFSRVVKRYAVLFRLKKDPYDIFDDLIEFHQDNTNAECLFFVHVGDYGLYDKPISYLRSDYRSRLMNIADYHEVNLLVSYESFGNVKKIERDVNRLQSILKREVKILRFHFNRLNIPNTYRQLSESEFSEDYTMGYSEVSGFRASTSKPFYYYDPVYEIKLPVKLHPFCLYKSTALTKHSITLIQKYKKSVKEVNGHFIIVLSNTILSNSRDKWSEVMS